jgi:predicted component of type VI protein secretion system
MGDFLIGYSFVHRLQQKKTVIGRHLSVVDIYLNSSVNKRLISREHAELWIECYHDKQVVYLLDKSTNGTFVNDIKIVGKIRLQEGDTLTFGHTQGLQIQPGMHRKQLDSEFRFMLEKVPSEILPPHGVSHPDEHSLSTYYHQVSATSTCTTGQDTEISSNESVEVSHNEHSQEPATYRQECFQNLSCTTNVKLSPRNCQSPTMKCPLDLGFGLSKTRNCSVSKITHMAADPTHATKTAPQNYSSTPKKLEMCTFFARPSDERTLTSSECNENTNSATETDIDLLELTSIISAKASNFDSSDSERDLERIFPGFMTTNLSLQSSEHISPQTKENELASGNSAFEGEHFLKF